MTNIYENKSPINLKLNPFDDYEQKNSKYWDFQAIKQKQIPQRGDFVDECQRLYDMDSDPSKLGKCRAFNYSGNQESKFREPRLILGP